MTQNQIAYQALLETKRHNEATETLEAYKVAYSAVDTIGKLSLVPYQQAEYAARAYQELYGVTLEEAKLIINAYDAATRRQVGESTVAANTAIAQRNQVGTILDVYSAYTNRMNAMSNALSAEAQAKNADTRARELQFQQNIGWSQLNWDNWWHQQNLAVAKEQLSWTEYDTWWKAHNSEQANVVQSERTETQWRESLLEAGTQFVLSGVRGLFGLGN